MTVDRLDLDPKLSARFAAALLTWWDRGHADLPWRRTRDPYAIWVAEVMLQQTQVATVIPYYERWMARFPTVHDLARAPLDAVLKQWEGLGYYGRARNMHHAAHTVAADMAGQMPDTVAGLKQLRGIGDYTAGAVASIAFDRPVPVVDGNVTRVLSRVVDLEDDVTRSGTRRLLWHLAADLVPASRAGDYNQALMELGQTVCLPDAPRCAACPVQAQCLATRRGTQHERPVRPPRRRTPHYDVVAGIIWRDDGALLITRRPLGGMLGGLWEFPGGKCEAGESHSAALRREIQEELALAITVGRHQVSLKHAYTHFRITLHAYHATVLSGHPRNLGVADHAWVRPAELESYPFAVTDQRIIASLWESGA